ncbi:MAG: hypothetical protein MUO40_07270 [Anaerolineaceae bacterium]|nr:hypothetical protein [Anaerolineaceae bacterium]
MANRMLKIFIISFAVLLCSSCTPVPDSLTPTPTSENTPSPTLTPTACQITGVHQTDQVCSFHSDEQAYDYLLDLIKGSENCRFPCWAGIVPGVTSIDEALLIFQPLLTVSSQFYYDQTFSVHSLVYYPVKDHNLMVNIDYDTSFLKSLDSPNAHSYIHINTDAQHLVEYENQEWAYWYYYDSPEYKNLFSNYSIQSFLSNYGNPQEVVTFLEDNIGEDWSPDFFALYMLYPYQGIYLRYETEIFIEEGIVSFCPNKTFAELWLFSPDNPADNEAILSVDKPSYWQDLFERNDYYKTIEDAIDIDTSTFIEELMVNPDNCYTTRVSDWPSQ